ncbi:MAG TPA: hypothetical protein VFD38_10185 [Myxococcaceae bacterium]|nr:hypothetical protein [Myxococcaceae bacterium]
MRSSPGTIPPSTLPSWRRVEPWAAALALGGCALRLARGLGPAPFYNSDCAVPILLMQGMGEGAFTLFYPRQDRFGMWPFLLGRALHLQTPEAYHPLSVLVLCSAALPLSAVLGSPALGVLTLMVPFVLSQSVVWNFLQAGQPYLWQVVALCWAWWACRVSIGGGSPRRRWLALLGFFVAAALATWMNTASLAALLAVGVLEVFRARARPRPRRALGALAALGAAGAVDAALRARYSAYCLRTFGQRFVTPLRIDHGHVLANIGRVVASLRHEGGLWPLLVGILAVAVPRRPRTERFDGLSLLAFGASVLPGLVLIRYFRTNDFAGRYLSLPTFWALAAAVHGVVLLASSLAGRFRWAVPAVALAALLIAMPAGPADPIAGPRADAARLAAAGPAVLLADYLEVYVPASLAPRGVLVPVGAEGNLNRFPGTVAELRPGRLVLAPCALDRPDGTLEQHGALLRRTGETPIAAAAIHWCRHAVERAARPLPGERPP